MRRVLLTLPESPPPTVRLEGERFHHLCRVLRSSPGEAVEVFDGRGRAFRSRILSIDEQGAVLQLGPEEPPRPLRRLTVVQGLPKGEKMEAILRHGTELGASAFAPAFSERSLVKLDSRRSAERLRRWTRIVEEAARQCGRAEVPEVLPPRPLAQAVAALAQEARVLVLDEEERKATLSGVFASVREGKEPLALVVGPEGGLARAEVEELRRLGAQPVTLGPRILRTETAALAALSVLLHLDGELG